jgi:hypothetical protein
LPFIGLLKELLEVGSFEASRTDYRLVKGQHKAQDTYFLAAGDAVAQRAQFEALWTRLCNGL